MAHISEAAPLQISRFYTGWYSFRNPLIVPVKTVGRRIIELYDSIWDGLNMECSNTLTLKRRPGYSLVSSTTIPAKALYFHSFKPSSFPGQIYQLVDSTSDIVHFQPKGVNYEVKSLIGKFTPALTNFADVGAYSYMAQELLAKKWDAPGGVQGLTDWGIDMYDDLATQGPSPPTSVTNMSSKQSVPFPWTISGQGGSVDLSRADPTTEGTIVSGWLAFTGFNFQPNFGGNLITDLQQFAVSGMIVQLKGITAQGEGDIGFHVRLMRNNELYGTFRQVTLPPVSPTLVIGRPNDPWDGAWAVSDILQSGFGVAVQAVNASSQEAKFSLTGVTLTMCFNRAPLVGMAATPPGTARAAFVAEVGYRYAYCYGNSHSGHISSPTLPSWYEGSTGLHGTLDGLIVPNGTFFVQVDLVPSPDPQVTDIHVFRTTDGGGLPFFELPGSPIPNWNNPNLTGGIIPIADAALDSELQIANIMPDQHFNDPPPGGMLDPVWYAGRLWGHRGHQLFFASGPDVSMGNGEEAWYPVYTFALPHGQIVRKFPTPNGLLLVTNDEMQIVRGISTASFTVNDFAKDIGMRVWTAGDSDGTNIYLLTSDRQFLLLNANGFTSVSSAIADQIAQVDPTLAYVAQFRYTARTNMVFVGDGLTFLYPFNQELQAWAVREQPVFGAQAIGSVEVTPGVHQFWLARPDQAGNSLISQRDTTGQIFSDEGTAYPCHVVFGCIPLADLLTVAQVRDIALKHASTSSRVILSALANEIFSVANKQFEILQISSSEPPELSATPSLSFTGNRYTWMSSPLPEHVNEVFFRIDFSDDANPDELYIWTLGGTQTTGGSALGPPGQLPQLQGR